MKRILPLLILSTATLFSQQPAQQPAQPPAAPKSWTITGDVQGYPINETCVFTQTADKISGSCKNAEGKSYDTTVTIDGQKVVLVHGGEYDGNPLTLTYTGTYNDKGEVSGSIDIQPGSYAGTFTAKKTEKTEKP